ncbi:MAG: UDP-N-acetylmuramate--L-alanine ligase [Chlorobiota bacterium]|nr:MAG: UDP-N-acetylmuramate--L-alanine ligase [Chlorobiota bacterium]
MAILTSSTLKGNRLYFLGIGGIAMGSVALACHHDGAIVSGCDSGIYPPMSTMLDRSGIAFAEHYSQEHLLAFQPDAVIVGNAISRGNPALEAALDANLPLISMPELLRWHFLQHRTRIVISGTHGKTTTTSMIAWILRSCGLPTGHLIGGAVDQLGASCVRAPVGGLFVLEGDEYDTAFFDKRSKFLHTMPHVLVITSIEYDHADIFPTFESVRGAFEQLVRLVPRSGLIVAAGDDPGVCSVAERSLAPVLRYGMGAGSQLRASIVECNEERTTFAIEEGTTHYGTFTLRMHGAHNVRNATAAIAVARHLGLDRTSIAEALETFEPPKRRFEILCTWHGATVVDDFAHHPTAIKATLDAARLRFPNRRVVVCFEPRSNTSVRSIFQREFADALAGADVVVLCPVYRAERYAPPERLDRERLQRDLHARSVPCIVVPDSNNWGDAARAILSDTVQRNDVLLLLSNGNIGGLRQLLCTEAASLTAARA